MSPPGEMYLERAKLKKIRKKQRYEEHEASRIKATMRIWSLHEWGMPVRSGDYYKDSKGKWRLSNMFKEMPTNDLFQVQILASSVWEPPKRKTSACPGYEVMASHYVELLPGKVTNVNLGMSFSPPIGTTIVILPATGSLTSKWSLSGRSLKSNSTGEALVAVKNNSKDTAFIASGDILGQVVLLPGKVHNKLPVLLPGGPQESVDETELATVGVDEENAWTSEYALYTQIMATDEDHVENLDPAATKATDRICDEAEERDADDKRAGISAALQKAQDISFCNLKDATLITFDEETYAKGRRRSVTIMAPE